MDMKKIAPMLVVGALLIGGASFSGGAAYAKGKTSDRGRNFERAAGANGGGANGNVAFGGRGQGSGNAARMGGGFTAGEILAKDATSITLKLMDGGSKIVFLSDATTVNKSAQGTKDDLTVGTQVTVIGQAGTDGSVTATYVQIGGGFGVRQAGAPGDAKVPTP